MRAFDGPIMETRDAERAAVADAASDDLPGIGKIVSVLPEDIGHVAEMARLAIQEAERNEALETGSKILLDLMGRIHLSGFIRSGIGR